MENGSIDVFVCSRHYQSMPKVSIDVNYQVVEVSFGQTLLRHNIKKEPSNGAGNEECLRWQGMSYQNCNDTNSPNKTFLLSADSSFIFIDFETRNDKQLNTQIHCQKSHTVALVCQGLWRHT